MLAATPSEVVAAICFVLYNRIDMQIHSPVSINVNTSKGVTIIWADGKSAEYPVDLLRSMCPCAKCKEERNEKQTRKKLLNVLPGNYAGELAIENVEMVGNYAIRIAWSDAHDTGIYSFTYLRELA